MSSIQFGRLVCDKERQTVLVNRVTKKGSMLHQVRVPSSGSSPAVGMEDEDPRVRLEVKGSKE